MKKLTKSLLQMTAMESILTTVYCILAKKQSSEKHRGCAILSLGMTIGLGLATAVSAVATVTEEEEDL